MSAPDAPFSSWKAITDRNHRTDSNGGCPSCHYVAGNFFDWLKTMRRVLDTGDPVKVMVFSSCPLCGEESWAHYKRETVELANTQPDYLQSICTPEASA